MSSIPEEYKQNLLDSADDEEAMLDIISRFEEHNCEVGLVKANYRRLNVPNIGVRLIEMYQFNDEYPSFFFVWKREHPNEKMPEHGSVEWRELAEDYDEFDYEKLRGILFEEWHEGVRSAIERPILEIQDFGYSTVEEWDEMIENWSNDPHQPHCWDNILDKW